MSKPLDNNALAPYVAGTPLDQLYLRIRRQQMAQPGAQPSGLVGGLPKNVVRNAPQANAAPKQPSLAEQLFQQATVFDQKGPIFSVAPSGNGWIAVSDLPLTVQKILANAAGAHGYGVAGFAVDSVKDPKQLQLLNQWVSLGQKEKDARTQQAAQNDPVFQQQLKAASANQAMQNAASDFMDRDGK